jgi:hypothetical protein
LKCRTSQWLRPPLFALPQPAINHTCLCHVWISQSGFTPANKIENENSCFSFSLKVVPHLLLVDTVSLAGER